MTDCYAQLFCSTLAAAAEWETHLREIDFLPFNYAGSSGENGDGSARASSGGGGGQFRLPYWPRFLQPAAAPPQGETHPQKTAKQTTIRRINETSSPHISEPGVDCHPCM